MYESFPWLLLAATIVLLVGSFMYKLDYRWDYNKFTVYKSDDSINYYDLFKVSSLAIPAVWLTFTAIGLGLALGVRQFWMPSFKHLWAFELHRSVQRHIVLLAKIIIAAAAFVLSLGVVWIALYILYASKPFLDYKLPAERNLYEGFLLIGYGFVVYLATALVGLNTTRWYTTRGFPFGFAIIIIFAATCPYLYMSLIVLIVGCAILLLQIFDTFLNREF